MIHCIKRFLADDDGPTAVEYAVMLAMIIGVVIVGIGLLGGGNADMWQRNADEFAAAGVGK